MFRVADLRNKILFTLGMIALYRLGSYVPAPGIDLDAIQSLKSQADESGGVLAYMQLFSGAGLTNFAVFALGVMPYITSSIIMQILTVVIPKLEDWQQMGAVGQRKLTQATRYVTVALAIMQSVVRIRPAIDAAFCSARRVTLAGSITPICSMSPNSPDAAL